MNHSCTLVTAFYAIRSKFKKETYLEWGRTFLSLSAPIVLFTEPELAPIFREMRGSKPMHLVELPFEQLEMWILYQDTWKQHHAMDPEHVGHTPELYAIWAQKSTFVEHAIHLNPFHTDFFFWCDFGAFRNPYVPQEVLASFPMTTYLSTDTILFQAFCPLKPTDWSIRPDGIPGEPITASWNEPRLVGGLWGGGTRACLRWSGAYKAMLQEYIRVGRFAGKDQAVMLSAYLRDPSLATVIHCTVPEGSIDGWFFLEYLLSTVPTVFHLDSSYQPPFAYQPIRPMKRLVQIIQLPELIPLPVMKQVFSELCAGFKEDDACEIRMITAMDQLEDGGWAFLDDMAGNYRNKRDIYDEIGRRCPNTVFVCWYWMDRTFRPFKRMIYTGEYCLHVPRDHIDRLAYFMDEAFVPLKLRASDSPSKIGTYPRKEVRDYCYMGGGYLLDWVPRVEDGWEGIYHQVFWDNYLSYDQRRENYLSSMFALGFQSEANIQSGHLSQRIFEGLAYGCIVLCNNPMATFYTDGAIIYISSKEDLVRKMHYYKNHPKEREKQQAKGYAWSALHGTNRTTMTLLKEKVRELYRLAFTRNPY